MLISIPFSIISLNLNANQLIKAFLNLIKNNTYHQDIQIAFIDLGYVSLPLIVEFSKIYSTVGFDINTTCIEELGKATRLTFSNDLEQLSLQRIHYRCTHSSR